SQPAGFPRSVNTSEVCEEERFLSAPALADLSGDGAAEVIISIRGRLTLAFDGSSGSSLPIARFILGSGAPACPVPADLDGDGRLDMLCSDGEGFLYAYETGSENPASVQWAGLGGGAAHTGFSSRAQQHPGPGVSTEIIPGEYCYVYPNPVRDSRAHLVYRLGKSDVDRVEVEVLTASGETVARLEGGTVAAGELANEVIWEVDKIASGVYLVLIKAHSQSAGTAKLIRKVAVIK
ncbi:MAG: T9SS type A sorting domain-containing protein, partial [Gemmatimonadota bacterium]|nr:T9SS type A sorting domain-containing protein [Gemmatimonadota bacterium]